MGRNAYFTVNAVFNTVTEQDALCVTINDQYEWFPMGTWNCDKPMISFVPGDRIEFEAQQWILEQKGLDDLIEGEGIDGDEEERDL